MFEFDSTNDTTKDTPMVNPLSVIKGLYNKMLKDNDIKILFATRNDSKVVVPFLDSLNVPYIIVSDAVLLVKQSEEIVIKLQAMGFKPTKDFLPNTKFYEKHLALTSVISSERIYQSDYNIDLHLVEPEQWHIAVASNSITTDVCNNKDEYLSTYLKVFTCISRLKLIK